MQLKRSVLVDQPAELLFDVIEAAEHYPRVLPWCAGAQILQRDDQVVKGNKRFEVVCLAKTRRQRDERGRKCRKQRGFLKWTALQRGLHRSCITRLARLVRQRGRELKRRNHDANVSILQAAKRPTQRRLGRQRCARRENRLPDARI